MSLSRRSIRPKPLKVTMGARRTLFPPSDNDTAPPETLSAELICSVPADQLKVPNELTCTVPEASVPPFRMYAPRAPLVRASWHEGKLAAPPFCTNVPVPPSPTESVPLLTEPSLKVNCPVLPALRATYNVRVNAGPTTRPP